MPSFSEAQPAPAAPPRVDLYRLMRRWFIQYNPLYLASAGLLLAGVLVLSEHLRDTPAASSELWLSATIELYQWVLIGGAALLYRVARQKRPAVILAIMAVVFLADVPFRTEVAGGLGTHGLVAACAWLASVGLKLTALARAMRLHLSHSAMALPMGAAVGMAFVPYALHEGLFERTNVATGITLLVFIIAAAATWFSPTVSSEDALDAWGARVLRRATRSTWMIWLAMFACHVAWWAFAFDLDLAARLLALTPLVAALHVRTEARVWLLVVGGCATAGVLAPQTLSFTAALAFVVLILVGMRGLHVRRVVELAPQHDANPYRAPEPSLTSTVTATTRDEAASRRCYAGALLFAYLGASTFGYSGGPLPEHHVGLDITITAGLLYLAATWRMFSPLAAALAIVGHWAVAEGALITPDGSLQWGLTLISLGFAVLIAGIALSWSSKSTAHEPEHVSDPTAPPG